MSRKARQIPITTPAAAAATDGGTAATLSNAAPPTGPATALQTITLPELVEPPTGMYCPRHIELRLDGLQAATLKTLSFSLQAAGIEIRSPGDALKWLLDRLTPAAR